MNPREWKREHQIALLCAVALGIIVGTVIGLNRVHAPGWCPVNWTKCSAGYWLAVAAWAAFGGAIGAALIFIRQLLRA